MPYETIIAKTEGAVGLVQLNRPDRMNALNSRVMGELTSALDTKFVKVPREGLATRFLPVKDGPELESRRSEILGIARDRGVIL